MPDETGTGAIAQDVQTEAVAGAFSTFFGPGASRQDDQRIAGVGIESFFGTGAPIQDAQTVHSTELETFTGAGAVAQAEQIIAGFGIDYHGGARSSPGGPQPGGTASLLNLSATTLVKGVGGKNVAGTVYTINVTTAGSSTGALYDYNATSGYGTGNLIGIIPEAVGTYKYEFPFFLGLVYVPGTNMVASVAYS